jgi:CheY-like chemotaxis protein
MKNPNLILFIDDNISDNDYHEIEIQKSGVICKFKSITNSHKALEYLRYCLIYKNDPQIPIPDIVFLDINMPAMNGFELLDRLRTAPDPYNQKHDMKIFMLSGTLNPDDRKKANEEYGDLIKGFCSKPLNSDTFLDILKNSF